MSRAHLADRRALNQLPPTTGDYDLPCRWWPECGCDDECASERHRLELLRRPMATFVQFILIAAIIALATFAIIGAWK